MNNIESIRKENLEQEKYLLNENKEILLAMVMYLMSSKLCDYEIEIIRRDLIGMAIEAQIDGSSLKILIGNDYRKYCDELINIGDKKKSVEVIFEIIISSLMIIGFLFIVEVLIFFLFTDVSSLSIDKFNIPLNFGFIISVFMVIVGGYIFMNILKTKSVYNYTNKKIAILGCLFSGYFLFIIGIRYLFRSNNLCNINYIISIVVILSIYIIVQSIYKIIKN